jgi:hypothetical protein
LQLSGPLILAGDYLFPAYFLHISSEQRYRLGLTLPPKTGP